MIHLVLDVALAVGGIATLPPLLRLLLGVLTLSVLVFVIAFTIATRHYDR